MRLAITGSHGVGKSTLINNLLNYLNKETDMKIAITDSRGAGKTILSQFIAGKSGGFKLLPEAPRQALQFGFSINEQTTIETEFWIFAKQLEMELVAGDNYVADRCFIDLLAYAMHLFAEKADFIKVLREIAKRAVRKYDLVIYLPTGEFPIEDDGVRSLDPRFQRAIDKLIREILDDFEISYTKIIGDKVQRYNQAVDLIDAFFYQRKEKV